MDGRSYVKTSLQADNMHRFIYQLNNSSFYELLLIICSNSLIIYEHENIVPVLEGIYLILKTWFSNPN